MQKFLALLASLAFALITGCAGSQDRSQLVGAQAQAQMTDPFGYGALSPSSGMPVSPPLCGRGYIREVHNPFPIPLEVGGDITDPGVAASLSRGLAKRSTLDVGAPSGRRVIWLLPPGGSSVYCLTGDQVTFTGYTGNGMPEQPMKVWGSLTHKIKNLGIPSDTPLEPQCLKRQPGGTCEGVR